MERIAVSTGEVDKRTINGNNRTKRGPDKQPRKRKTGYYVLKDEVKAGLAVRCNNVIDHYGGPGPLSRLLRINVETIIGWRNRGQISPRGAQIIHNLYKRQGGGFRATYCRPDLRFDGNGKPLTTKCDRREMLRVVR